MSSLGVKALKGVDADRFALLYNANKLLPIDKQISFNVMCVMKSIIYDGSGGYHGGYDSWDAWMNLKWTIFI